MNRNVQPRPLFGYNIFLIGFMGSGKSSVAGYLGRNYGMEVVEMDQRIAEMEGMSIPDIFAKYGEAYFRDLETEFLADLNFQSNRVVSCGGGVPMREANVAEMRKSGKIVLLTASPETIFARVKNNHDRPLLENHKNVAYISELMAQRRERYEAAADVMIETDRKTVREICREMIYRLDAQRA